LPDDDTYRARPVEQEGVERSPPRLVTAPGPASVMPEPLDSLPGGCRHAPTIVADEAGCFNRLADAQLRKQNRDARVE
jgi:hypothetical protein